MSERPFRFGVIAEQFTTRQAWIDLARRAEALGYDTLLIRDHFASEPFGHQFAPFSALAVAASVTNRLRLGTMVIDNDYRHPAVLAKEAATLDLLSDGRFELGLGAGWLEAEYRATGIPYDPAGLRIDRLEESIAVLKGLFTGERVHHDGTHYQIDGLVNFPLPAQRPRPPLLIGGGGKRVLGIAGREADTVGILTTSVATGTVTDDPVGRRTEAMRERIGWIQDGAGARFNQIELSVFPDLVITGDRRAATKALISRCGWADVDVEHVWDMPAIFIGTVDQIVTQMRERRAELGISYFIVADAEMEVAAPIVATLHGQ